MLMKYSLVKIGFLSRSLALLEDIETGTREGWTKFSPIISAAPLALFYSRDPSYPSSILELIREKLLANDLISKS